ncbi:MAG: M24 family metallopeptidase [Bacteroidota bacterium]
MSSSNVSLNWSQLRWLVLIPLLMGQADGGVPESEFAGRMTHGVSHHLGLDAHDAGGYDTLKAGMVITVEPGVYIPSPDTAFAPSLRGYGIRIEDDVLVSDTGAVVLSSEIPKSVKAIEDLMKRRKGQGVRQRLR